MDESKIIKDLLEVMTPDSSDMFITAIVADTSDPTTVGVRPVSDNGDGDILPYQRLSSYVPTLSDRVLCVKVGSSRIVIGKIA